MNSTIFTNNKTTQFDYYNLIYLCVGLIGNMLIAIFGFNERKRNKKIHALLTQRIDDVGSQISQITDRSSEITNVPYGSNDISLDALSDNTNVNTIIIPLDSTRQIEVRPKQRL